MARGAPTGGRSQRTDPDQARAQQEATETAAAEQTVDLYGPTQGATAGVEQRDRKGPHRPEEARDRVEPAAVASFTKELAEMATADPADAGPALNWRDGQEVESEFGEDRSLFEARPARKETIDFGGEDDPEPAEPPPPTDPTPPAGGGGSVVPRLRPRARATWLGLEASLAAGAEAGILVGYQAALVPQLIPRLTSASWTRLVEALSRLESAVLVAFVLKALAAHRHPDVLPAFAARLKELGPQEALQLQWARGPMPPLTEEVEPRDLRLHYDPIEALFPGERRFAESAPADPWPMPRWVRGIPRVPLELSIVAVDQALSEDLRPGERTGDGAGDALTAALGIHGDSHPSMGRWLLNLCARAETRYGMVHMREVMMRARLEMAREDTSSSWDLPAV